MRTSIGLILRFVPCLFVLWALLLTLAGSSQAANPPLITAQRAPQESEIYSGWLKMYDLRFDDAPRTFGAWKQSHPHDSTGPASGAAAYLFSDWPDWALSNLSCLSMILAFRTARSCGPSRR